MLLLRELDFVRQGGYRRGSLPPGGRLRAFVDSPTCRNPTGEAGGCRGCPLLYYVETRAHAAAWPCQSIRLDGSGRTLAACQHAPWPSVEARLDRWLVRAIAALLPTPSPAAARAGAPPAADDGWPLAA